jgi:hypothetical protein
MKSFVETFRMVSSEPTILPRANLNTRSALTHHSARVGLHFHPREVLAIRSLCLSPVSRDCSLAIATPAGDGLVFVKRRASPMGYSRHAISF